MGKIEHLVVVSARIKNSVKSEIFSDTHFNIKCFAEDVLKLYKNILETSISIEDHNIRIKSLQQDTGLNLEFFLK